MPGVVPGATVMVPSAFIVIAPSAGAGAVPGVRLTLVPITAGLPLVVSLATTEAVLPPVAGTAAGVSAAALMDAVTVTLSVIRAQFGVGVARSHSL